MPCPPLLWLCNKVLKPNFQSIISQTDNGCSLLSLILAMLLLLDMYCHENIFVLSRVTALTACPFSLKKCAKMSFFMRKPTPFACFAPTPSVVPPSFAKSWVRLCPRRENLEFFGRKPT